MIRTLNARNSHALLESPTGSGKSMSLLCGVLSWLEHRKHQEGLNADEIINAGKGLMSTDHDLEYWNQKNSANSGDFDPDFIASPPLSGKRSKMEIDTPSSASLEKSFEQKEKDAIVKFTLPKIYITSRTHKQIAQLVRELTRSVYEPKFVVLGSRTHYCINDKVRKSGDITEGCRVARKEGKCSAHCGTAPFLKKMGPHWTPNCDIEDLVTKGKSFGACPYYIASGTLEDAEVVFAPYNYLIDPGVREAMKIESHQDVLIVDEAHNIEDVCRESASFEATDETLHAIQSEIHFICTKIDPSKLKLKPMRSEDGKVSSIAVPVERLRLLKGYHESQAHVISILSNWLKNASNVRGMVRRDFETSMTVWMGKQMAEELISINITYDFVRMWQSSLSKLNDDVRKLEDWERDNAVLICDLENNALKFLSFGTNAILSGLYRSLENVLKNNNQYLSSFRMVRFQVPKMDADRNRRMVTTWGLWCLNPEVTFKGLTSLMKSIILTSGTLSPMETIAAELGTHFEERLEALHIIDPHQTWVASVPIGPTGVELLGNYKTMDSFAYQDDVARAIASVCQVMPGGVLVFVPSYAFLEKLINRMRVIGVYDDICKKKKVFLEPRQGLAKDFDRLMKNYYSIIKSCQGKMAQSEGLTGGLMFAVYRGKISEGLDLKDDNCRVVIPIGIPYPAFKDPKVVLKKEFNDAGIPGRRLFSGQKWYESQAFRALNQALGRCIRHRLDWGAVLLLDQRFSQPRNAEQLSKWVRNRFRPFPDFATAVRSLESFALRNAEKDQEKIIPIKSALKPEVSTVKSVQQPSLPSDIEEDIVEVKIKPEVAKDFDYDPVEILQELSQEGDFVMLSPPLQPNEIRPIPIISSSPLKSREIRPIPIIASEPE